MQRTVSVLLNSMEKVIVMQTVQFSPCFPAKPDVTLTISDTDLVDLMTGKLNSQKAFFQGKLKVGSFYLEVEE